MLERDIDWVIHRAKQLPGPGQVATYGNPDIPRASTVHAGCGVSGTGISPPVGSVGWLQGSRCSTSPTRATRAAGVVQPYSFSH